MDASYEKLGSFYLGNKYDLAQRQALKEIVTYDSKDLTTHALCIGMTGSGKTGLCLALLEEAAIDGIPAIVVDPKGDLGNLLLTFPELKADDFKGWLEPSEAERQGLSLDELAQHTADKWRTGLEKSDQSPERIAKFRDAVDIAIYTPGSNAGLPITILRSFEAPSAQLVEDQEMFRERVATAASGLLALLGIDVDPLNSREHILLSNIFNDAWSKGQNLELGSLIRLVQTPPMPKVGVLDLETFMPSADRKQLAMSLNNLLASPSFAGWLEGEALDIKNLLTTPAGKPRLSILSIAHLSDAERMFFLTILLNELLSWVRAQPGTSSLRALFYMDEIFGYFPPTAMPPSKLPMLHLLKQSRAHGLGVILATQNPADLDYKGLANIGTWFLGRLQTERDKARILEGLEGAALQAGSRFDRTAMEATLSSLAQRVFLMNNVHDDQLTLFQSRWALSFLRGPLSRPQIQQLMHNRKANATKNAAASSNLDATAPVASTDSTINAPSAHGVDQIALRPVSALDIPEYFCAASRMPTSAAQLIYKAALLGDATCHYVRAAACVDQWVDLLYLSVSGTEPGVDVWDNAQRTARDQVQLMTEPAKGFAFNELPADMLSARNYKRWQTQLKDFLYRHERLRVFECPDLKAFSQPGQDELDARLSLEQKMREVRDAAKEKLRVKYSREIQLLESKILAAQQKVDDQSSRMADKAFDLTGTLLGMFLGNKRRGASSAVRGLGKAAQQRTASRNAQETLEQLMTKRQELVDRAEGEIEELKARYAIHEIPLVPVDIPCRKSDTRVNSVSLVWLPWALDHSGQEHLLVDLT